MPSTVKTRFAESLKKLLYKKPFHKISVNELCETASLSRSSFYANFEDKYQLFSYCLQEQRAELEFLMRAHSPEEFLQVMLDFIQQENRFFYHAFGASYDEELFEIFYHFFTDLFSDHLQENLQRDAKLSGPVEYIFAFYLGGLTNMVLRWIKSNYSISRKELAACQYQLCKDFIDRTK